MLTKNIGKIWVRECGWKFSYQANNYCTHSISSCEAGLTVWLHHSQGIFFHQGGVLDIMSTWLGTKLQLSYLMFVVQLQTTSTELTTNLCKTYNQHTPGISWPYDQIKRRHLHASARETALVHPLSIPVGNQNGWSLYTHLVWHFPPLQETQWTGGLSVFSG